MRTRIFLRLVLVVVPTVGLMLVWLAFLPRQGRVAAAEGSALPVAEAAPPAPDGASPAPAATPDPRWVEIVRAREAAGGAAPDASSLTINLNLTDFYASGRVPSPATVEITLMDQGEVLLTLYTTPVPEGGGFFYWAYLYLEPGELQPGLELWVTQSAATISMTVPALTGLAYPQTDILSGTAPANAELFAYLFPFTDPGQVYTATATAGGDGAYQIPWAPAVDIRPRDSGYLLYSQDADRQAYLRVVAPFLRVQVNSSFLYGAAAPHQVVDMVVKDNLGALLEEFTTSTSGDGYFSAGPCGVYGLTVFLPSYQVIAVAGGQTFSTTVVNVTAQADRPAGQVTGQAPPGQPVEITLYSGPLQIWGTCPWYDTPIAQRIVTATVEGEYTADLPLAAGNYGVVQADTAAGNQVYAQFALPYLHARLGNRWEHVWGQVDEPSAPITVAVQGPSGYLKDWYTLETRFDGYFNDSTKPVPDLLLESGDRITVTTSQGPRISLLLPVLTAEADPATDIVSGQAPPFSLVVITMYSFQQLTMTVTADAEGAFSADFSSLGGIDSYGSGIVKWTSAEGYDVERYFTVEGDFEPVCPPKLSSVRVGGNELRLTDASECGALTFRLRNAGGQVKFEQSYPYSPGYIDLFAEDGRPVLIMPGDQIEVTSDGQTTTTVVPTLTVGLDPHTDLVTGQAPPLAELRLVSFPDPVYLTTTASAQGDYVFDLAGIYDVDAGSYVFISLDGDPSYYRIGLVPDLETVLYSREVGGHLEPFTPYTITLSSPLTTSALITGYASAQGYFPNGPYPPPVGYHGNPGDKVKMETPGRLWEMTIPFLTASVDTAAGTVSGQAPASSHLIVSLSVNYQPEIKTPITATVGGTYSVAFQAPPGPVHVSGYVAHLTAFDMRTYLHFNTPYWFIEIGSKAVYGTAPVYGVPVTATLQSYDGRFNESVTVMPHQGQFRVDFDRPVHPGDKLALYTPEGLASEFTVPYLTAVYDFTRRVLEGRAPPGGSLRASIPGGDFGSDRHIVLQPDGTYGVDASDLDMRVGAYGFVYYDDPLGNHVMCRFYNNGYPGYLPLIRLLAGP